MKFASYQPWIYLHGGIERSVLELVTRSRHDWTIYTSYYDPAGTFPGFKDVDVRVVGSTSVDRDMLSVLKSAVSVGRQKLPLEPDVDGLVIWCDGIGDLVTFRNHSLPVFNICCTPLRAAFDPAYQKQALESRSALQRVLFHTFKHGFRLVDRLAWRHYRNVIAISGEVKRRILAGGLSGNDRIHLAYPGVEWSPDLPDVRYDPFILVSGRIMWTKNIELAIRAFLAADAPAPWQLVIAGYVDAKSESYIAGLRALAGDSGKVKFVVSPSDETMADLQRKAAFSLFTPLNEDWGIVPLEAMAQAKAVIAVDAGGPRESIVHGSTGYLLPPDVTAWAATISKLIADPALTRSLGAQAHAHVKRFTWSRFVSDVDTMLERWVMAESASTETAEQVIQG